MSLGTLTVVHTDKVSPVSGWPNGVSLEAGLHNETRSLRHEARATEVVREETPKNIPQSLTLSLSLPLSLSPSPLLIPLFTILTSSYSSSFPLLVYTLQDVSRTAHCAEVSSRRELVGLACCEGQCVRGLTKKHDYSVIIYSPLCHFKPMKPFFCGAQKENLENF